MKIRYRKYQASDKKTLRDLVAKFYIDDPPTAPASWMNIDRTIKEFKSRPTKGRIWIFERNHQVVGYAITVNYWANEYGGNFITIDELFVDRPFRRQGIAGGFIDYLVKNRINNSVGLQLEVHQHNRKVIKLYKEHGFKTDNILLSIEFDKISKIKK
ncbi:MAG: GNAT family N-acetyltransferase [Parcubacteria group bacterium]